MWDIDTSTGSILRSHLEGQGRQRTQQQQQRPRPALQVCQGTGDPAQQPSMHGLMPGPCT